MYTFGPITPRVADMRERYRNTKPELDLNRYKIVTEFYMEHRDITGCLKRAYNFQNLCEKMPPHVNDGELIVGSLTTKYRAAAMFPENSVDWLKEEMTSGLLWERETDPYIVDDETRDYVLKTVDFWMQECMSAKMNSYIPLHYRELAGNGCCGFGPQGQAAQPVGHFCTGYNKAIRKGFKAIKAEADAKIEELETRGITGNSAKQYNFYRSISIVCDGMITLAKRYSKHCAELARKEKNAVRKAELEKLAEVLDWVVENPARDFYEAVQALWFYEMCVMLDANMHGTSMGRVDQYLGSFAEADIASGKLTREQAQEILDLYYLKVAELNKPWSAGAVLANPGYTNGQQFTLGGIDKDGNDATNVCTYMCLEAAGRLLLHDPPQALRINRNTPAELWDCAIEVTKRAGGVPSFYSDDVIMEALTYRGRIAKEDVWDYCIIGCVEPSVGGKEWPACGGNGTETYTNIVNGFLMAINNGRNPMPLPDGKPNLTQYGPATGYLYEMESIEEVMKAYETQIRFWTTWDVNLRNLFESIAPDILPQPVVSATMDGCMEKGMDVMNGGSKYNSTGLSCVGVGNVVDCLSIIDQVCFKTGKYSTREMYDAIMANWEGYEEMRNYINGEVPRYGNADPEVDKYATFVMKSYADIGNSFTGPRGPLSVGCYPVTLNVLFGYGTWATPDGRKAHTPLSDGIGAVQGMDKNGPTATLVSLSKVPQNLFSNGILQNMKFHPTAISNEAGKQKLIDLMKTYFFSMGGMQLQLNIVSADTLRSAQKEPDKYRDLIVRVAGFSAYFVEVFKDSQEDLIRRTEQGL